MTLHISETEVRALLTMPMAVDAVEDISRKQASGEVVVHPRRRFESSGGNFFHYMAAADYTAGYLAMKQYTYVRGKLRFLVPLYEMASGELVALIEADYMGQLRTGAPPAWPPNISRDGMLGSSRSLAPAGRRRPSLK